VSESDQRFGKRDERTMGMADSIKILGHTYTFEYRDLRHEGIPG